MEKLVIIGTGEAAQDVKHFVEQYRLYDIAGYACSPQFLDKSKGEHPDWIINSDTELEAYYCKEDVKLFVAISQFQQLNKVRMDKFNELKSRGWNFATIISPSAIIHSKKIGEGSWIMDRVFIGNEAAIGDNVVLANESYVAHYSVVGKHSYMGGRSMLMGKVKVGDQSFIGARATVFNDVTIGKKCIIGGATTIKRNVPNYTRVKLPDNIVVSQTFREDEIEMKLVPPQSIKKTARY